MIQTLAKTAAVVVSSTILATLAVNAVDMRGSIASSLLGSVFSTEEPVDTGPCPLGMVLVTQALVPFCVDKYEASPADTCAYPDPVSEDETRRNIADPECEPSSRPNASPWRYVSQLDAQQACSRAGKRLLTPDEWYKAGMGTPDQHTNFTEDDCNVARNRADGVSKSGSGIRCVSDVGAYDMIGNVWEWVEGEVVHGERNGEQVPLSGYVEEAGIDGIARKTGSGKDDRFGNDRFWSDSSIVAGIMRGGYFDSKSNAGLFSTYAASPSSFSGEAVGFRCAVTLVQQYE